MTGALISPDANDIPAGTVTFTMANEAPPGWHLLDGSVIVDAIYKYPELWDRAPQFQLNTTDIILPEPRGRAMVAAGDPPGTTISERVHGSVGGSETHTLTVLELPVHTHTQNAHTHVHTHTHTINHNHPSGTTSSDTHNHGGVYARNVFPSTSGWYFVSALGTATGGQNLNANGTIPDDSHSHTFDVANYNGTSGGASSSSTQSATPTINNAGSGDAHSIMQPWMALNMMVKLA